MKSLKPLLKVCRGGVVLLKNRESALLKVCRLTLLKNRESALLKVCRLALLIVVSATSYANEQLMNSADNFSFQEDIAYPSLLIDNKTEQCVIPLSYEVLNQYGLKPEHIYPLVENTDEKSNLNHFETEEKHSSNIKKLCEPDTIQLVLSSFSNPAQYQPAAGWGIITGVGIYVGLCWGAYLIQYYHVTLICFPVWKFFDHPLPK